jgi:hypothetical protein
MMSKITLKTEKRPTKVSDDAISRAVEKAYDNRWGNAHTTRNGHAKRPDGNLNSPSKKKK